MLYEVITMLLQRIGRLPSDKAVEISRQICLGLGAIHKAGILHRDLKPSNIIIDQKGEARITDFGIAGIEAEVQGEESRVGTPAYMSPEQITGKEVTKRSVITSYSIHYTKLYDPEDVVCIFPAFVSLNFVGVWSASWMAVAAVSSPMLIPQAGQVVSSVITSYSIHYTKLYE